ncbi:MAG: N-acetyltransferase [Planctomycetes bacterium]|nr:N-acetyltransferase [Planctomycetota bacterium]MCB9916944.1 N-acetyltransferase [Planctomycetota bacterium]
MKEEVSAPARIRHANVRDVPQILEIINAWANLQEMLPRSPLSVYEGIRAFRVAERDGVVVGCGALHVVWGDLAEIRSIAVRPTEKGRGTGRALAEQLLTDAHDLLVPRVFAFTYVPGFFERLGFRHVEHAELPHKVFADCMNCPKFNACDEIAMVKELRKVDGTFPETGPLSRPLPRTIGGPHRVEPRMLDPEGHEV